METYRNVETDEEREFPYENPRYERSTNWVRIDPETGDVVESTSVHAGIGAPVSRRGYVEGAGDSVEDVPTGNVKAVRDWVDGDPARAALALDVELSGRKRKGLVGDLQQMMEAAGGTDEVDPSEVPEGTPEELLDWVGSDTARAAAALLVELDGENRTSLVEALLSRAGEVL